MSDLYIYVIQSTPNWWLLLEGNGIGHGYHDTMLSYRGIFFHKKITIDSMLEVDVVNIWRSDFCLIFLENRILCLTISDNFTLGKVILLRPFKIMIYKETFIIIKS